MNSSSGEKITKSSKKLTFRMIVRASVAECSVRFASVLPHDLPLMASLMASRMTSLMTSLPIAIPIAILPKACSY